MGNIIGSLKKGLVIEDVAHTEFELREATVEDMLDAEQEASVATPLNFNAQMMVRQIVKISTKDGKSFTGPFTIGMIKKLSPADFRTLRTKQGELDKLGEAE